MSLLLSVSATAEAQGTAQSRSARSLDRMMVALGPHSARTSRLIKKQYRQHLDLLVLNKYADLEGALFNGGLAPLPADPVRFNLAPRVKGPFPIGEKDLANQVSYIAARPATIGALLEIASRVHSGRLEITSLVRHSEYQGALRSTNKNATTSVPMHTMGLAFDIALVNGSLETAYEIRDVLRRLQQAGDILFIGERKQLVFHVVPHPARLGHFTQVYARTLGAAPSSNGAHVVAFSRTPDRHRVKWQPAVSAEVIAVLPAVGFGEEWWSANHDRADLSVEVAAAPIEPALPPPSRSKKPRDLSRSLIVALAIAIAAVTVGTIRRPELNVLIVDRSLSSV